MPPRQPRDDDTTNTKGLHFREALQKNCCKLISGEERPYQRRVLLRKDAQPTSRGPPWRGFPLYYDVHRRGRKLYPWEWPKTAVPGALPRNQTSSPGDSDGPDLPASRGG